MKPAWCRVQGVECWGGDRGFGVYPLDDVVGDEVFDVSLVEAVQDVSPLALRVSTVSR